MDNGFAVLCYEVNTLNLFILASLDTLDNLFFLFAQSLLSNIDFDLFANYCPC